MQRGDVLVKTDSLFGLFRNFTAQNKCLFAFRHSWHEVVINNLSVHTCTAR